MLQIKYALSIAKRLGVWVNFWLCSEGDFLSLSYCRHGNHNFKIYKDIFFSQNQYFFSSSFLFSFSLCSNTFQKMEASGGNLYIYIVPNMNLLIKISLEWFIRIRISYCIDQRIRILTMPAAFITASCIACYSIG